ncbi:rod shape-determining protein RodA [Stenotrophobium rhamnosiphilum]|uniref:Peptidoglycan glycosyltransferase MrdB n=1 Tax=Stenotrophobium rhamnosiphilum TaxID=2029166 RepID=A0A2T5MDI3_9GAMM|nr:rod shape-determining protein RodA [Stenotrophobium rhamnosiphilum]PTU30634.1 rod shape-determining protein RodA [Stenotrophobium rhamnosiphilum]
MLSAPRRSSRPEPSLADSLERWHIDMWLLLLLLAIGVIGLVVLYSASGHSLDQVMNQGERWIIGLIVMAVVAQAPPEWYRAIAPWIYSVTVILLILTLAIGATAKGAQRWLDLGFLRFQPSEMMKLAMPMTVAAFLHGRNLPPRIITMLIALVMVLVPFALIAKQPDLGTALLVIAAGFFALFFAGFRWRWMIGALAALGAAAPLMWNKLHDYQRQRILTLLDPESDPLGTGYHITQSKIAIGSGGLFGKGWLNGSQAKLDFLPESHTDFIFAVYSEEFGLLGILLLLIIYLAVVARGLFIAARAQDTFQRLLAASLSMTFFIYVFINMGMVIGLLPVVGVPLPLVSYGGTSIVTLLTGFGMLMSVQTHRKLLSS